MGFKAQEIQELYPHLINQNPSNGQFFVNYMGLIPILTEAIKKQSEEIESLKIRIEELEKL